MMKAKPGQPLVVRRQGWVSYKDDGFLSLLWQKRYMILNDCYIDLYKGNKRTDSAIVSIPLTNIVCVSLHKAKPFCLEIVKVNSRPSMSVNGGGVASDSINKNNTKSIYVALKTEQELYGWVDTIFAKCPLLSGVSSPTNFIHSVHVGFEADTGNFIGLPSDWERMLAYNRSNTPVDKPNIIKSSNSIRRKFSLPKRSSSMSRARSVLKPVKQSLSINRKSSLRNDTTNMGKQACKITSHRNGARSPERGSQLWTYQNRNLVGRDSTVLSTRYDRHGHDQNRDDDDYIINTNTAFVNSIQTNSNDENSILHYYEQFLER